MGIIAETGVKPVDPASIPQRGLYTGATMPAVGLGTFGSDAVGKAEVAAAVKGAAAVGYRFMSASSNALCRSSLSLVSSTSRSHIEVSDLLAPGKSCANRTCVQM